MVCGTGAEGRGAAGLGSDNLQRFTAYISFNNTDQRAIKTGTTGALVIAIGALNPAVGIAAGLAVSIANEYIAGNGFCPSNDELWVYFTDGPTGPNYTQVVCRPVSHPGGG